MAAESFAETARRASAGTWRKPRMKIYDYNQEFGGNYYQPMIEYINTKEIQGPFHVRTEVYMPNKAEVTSDKYSNMRYNDKASTSLDLDNFLVQAYAKQIKELNSSTASAHYMIMHNSKDQTFFDDKGLIGGYVVARQARKKYADELASIYRNEAWAEEQRIRDALLLEENLARQRRFREMLLEDEEDITQRPENKELIKNARAKLFWLYQTRDMKEYKVSQGDDELC